MSENITRLRPSGQVTIPKKIREALHLKPGDLLHVALDDGRILLIPESAIDPDQAWFWTEEWQEGEREADEDIRAGRVYGPFDTVEEMIADMEARRAELESEED